MNNDKRMEQAARWFHRAREEENLGEVRGIRALLRWLRRKAFHRWLRRSKENIAAYIVIARLDALLRRRMPIDQRGLRELKIEAGTPEAARSKVVPMRARDVAAPSMAPDVARQAVRPHMSRRTLIAASIGTLTIGGIGSWGALTSLIASRRKDVIASGHVLKVMLRDGVMHAARNSAIRVHPLKHAHTVHLFNGQAGFHLWQRGRATTLLKTTLADVIAAAARFSVTALDESLEISVADGTVHVISAVFGVSELVLHAGEQLTLRRQAQLPPTIVRVDAERELAWTHGELYFDGDETLAEVAAIFNRFNEPQIVPAPDVAALRVATLQAVLDNPRLFAERFAADWNLATRREGRAIYIYKRDDARRPK